MRRTLVAVAAALALLATCQSSAVARPATDLTLRTIEKSAGAGSRITTQRTVAVRTERKWKSIWRQLHRPAKKLPKINFAKRTIIVATQGERSSTGYGIRIERVVLDGGELTLHVVETEPDPALGCLFAQVITHPYHIVSIRRTDRPLAPVERRLELATC
jgi:hypothetical protein